MGKSYVRPNEVLLQEGAWSIERSWEKPSEGTVRPVWWHDNTKSFVKHKCPGERSVLSVYVWCDIEKVCWRCGEPIPDGLKGVWLMHNWEAIQSER